MRNLKEGARINIVVARLLVREILRGTERFKVISTV